MTQNTKRIGAIQGVLVTVLGRKLRLVESANWDSINGRSMASPIPYCYNADLEFGSSIPEHGSSD